MIQWASSSSSMRTSVRRFPSNARVSRSARPMTSRAAGTASVLNLSSSSTVTGMSAPLRCDWDLKISDENAISTFIECCCTFQGAHYCVADCGRSLEDPSMQKALAPDISTWPDESPQLIGSRCGSCGATTFPVQQWCPRCSGGEMSELLLPRRGTLVAWTTQGFRSEEHTSELQ